jgi:histidine triad (HIT) family protein
VAFILAGYDECGFCRYVRRDAFCASVAENELAMAFVNLRQYERGAALVIPRRHVETILDATDAELAAISQLARKLARAAHGAFGATGANVFQNNGIKAGQHVPHMHTHVVPRYPESDPEKMFLQRNFAVITPEEQQTIAEALKRSL